ncbi:MAG: YCF48-related protein [Parcubacteria group bacterium]
MKKTLMLISLVAIVLLSTSGCIIQINKNGGSAVTGNLGGLFVSGDKMDTWQAISRLITPTGAVGSMSDTDVYFLRIDPSDTSALYAGTRADGLFYSLNAGASWNQVTKLPAGFVRDLVIDPSNKCTMYAAVEERVYKSIDCARTWKSAWFSGDTANKVASLGIDWYVPRTIYAGLADGTMLKSVDAGSSWQVSKKFSQRVNKIVVDPNDSHVVYVGVLSVGLYKTSDKGDNWESLNDAMKGFANANLYSDFTVSKSAADEVVYADQTGLLRSLDGGTTWSEIKLVSTTSASPIYSVAIDPKNDKNIYYGTASNLYKTSDAGDSWVVKRIPTTRMPGVLMVWPGDSSRIYLGVKTAQ